MNRLSLVSHNLTYKSDRNRERSHPEFGTGSLGVTSPTIRKQALFVRMTLGRTHTRAAVQITTPTPERTPPTRNQSFRRESLSRNIRAKWFAGLYLAGHHDFTTCDTTKGCLVEVSKLVAHEIRILVVREMKPIQLTSFAVKCSSNQTQRLQQLQPTHQHT